MRRFRVPYVSKATSSELVNLWTLLCWAVETQLKANAACDRRLDHAVINTVTDRSVFNCRPLHTAIANRCIYTTRRMLFYYFGVSANEVSRLYCSGTVFLSLCLSDVCQQDISKSYWRILTKFCGMIDLQPWPIEYRFYEWSESGPGGWIQDRFSISSTWRDTAF